MKKLHLLFIFSFLFIFYGLAQKNATHFLNDQRVNARPIKNLSNHQAILIPSKNITPISKSFGDTIFYEDFSDSSLSNWFIVNNNIMGCSWQWDTLYRSGSFSSPNNIITSTTASNGFMLLPLDSCNTPIPPTGSVQADTYFESDSIDLTLNGVYPNGVNSVIVSYQQTIRHCCNSLRKFVLQVSTDNFSTFTEYDAFTPNPTSTITNTIDISSAAGNAASIKVRFYSQGSAHFYWMIDDFTITEGANHDMQLSNVLPLFDTTYAISPFYSQIPIFLFNPLTFSGVITNNGAFGTTNARLEVSITNDSMRVAPGSPKIAGIGLQYLETTSSPGTLLSKESDTLVVGTFTPFIPSVFGDYSIQFKANSDSVDQVPFNDEDNTFSFSVTGRTLAKDNGVLTGTLSPANFVRAGIPGGTSAGDEMATLFIVEPNTNSFSQSPIPESVSFMVSNHPSNVGAMILPKIYTFNENATSLNTAIGNEVASAFLPDTIEAGDLGKWITVPFDNGTAFINGLTAGQYIVGWENTTIAGGVNFSVAEDQLTGVKQPGITTFINFGHDTTGWGTISPTTPGIRLHFAPLPVSISEVGDTKTNLTVNPVPSKGQIQVKAKTSSSKSYNLRIKNLLGQEFYNEPIEIKKQFIKQLDLSNLERGIYLLSLESDTERIVKKIILN